MTKICSAHGYAGSSLLLGLVLVSASLTSGQAIKINPPPGRVALSHDGNADPDDIGALPLAMAMLSRAGIRQNLVHVHYNNILQNAKNNDAMITSANGAADRFGFNRSILFDCRKDMVALLDQWEKVSATATAGSPIYLLAAGPMEVPYRMLGRVPQANRKHIKMVSHSGWNEDYSKSPTTHTWQQCKSAFQADGVQFINIAGQNYNLRNARSEWFWLRDHADADLRWLWSRDPFTDKFDPSDAGMTAWFVTGGDVNKGEERVWPNGVQKILEHQSSTPVSGESARESDRRYSVTRSHGIDKVIFAGSLAYRLTLHNLQGELLKRFEGHGTEAVVNTSGLEAGPYILSIGDNAEVYGKRMLLGH